MAVLAERLGVPKSSVHASFGSKVDLQVAVLRETREILIRLVVEPTLAVPAGYPRLVAVGESWLGYLQAKTFAGGCVLSSAASEIDGRPGPARDVLVGIMTEWLKFLSDNVRTAVAGKDMFDSTDPKQVAFELHAIGLTANWHHQLFGGSAAFRFARAAWAETLRRQLVPDSSETHR
jgi:AcrR family transcriptional regulator